MTKSGLEDSRGCFFHGDREETQAPAWTVGDLQDKHERITPEQAIEELATWPAAQEQAMEIFNRYPAED